MLTPAHGQVGDGAGIAAGQQLAADDALLGHLLHQGLL